MGTNQPSGTTLQVELFVRSLSPDTGRGPQSAVLEELRRLEETDRIDELSVVVWGREIGLSTTAARTETGRTILDRVGSFRSWAAANDRSLEPLLSTREVTSQFTGETHSTLVLPTMLLAEYRDDELHHVTPHETDGTVATVADRLEALATSSDRPAVGDTDLVTQ